MGKVIITTYAKDGSVSITIKPTHCLDSPRQEVTATKGDYSFRRWGFSPFRKWARFRERNGGL